MSSVDAKSLPAAEMAPELAAGQVFTGILHIYVAFDWGEEIDLDHARRLVPSEVHELPRRRRTPPSIAFRPAPLRFMLAAPPLELPEVECHGASAEAIVFDFAALSVSLRVPYQLPAAALSRLGGWLADPAPILRVARAIAEPLHAKLLPAIEHPRWQDDLSEEYFVFQLAVGTPVPTPDYLLGPGAGWLAALLRLETEPLSPQEVAEALRLHIRYGRNDLLVADWAAAVLVDRDCEETLQTLEFANLQLLELRHIDMQLDDRLATAYGMIRSLTKARLPFWRNHARSLRALGELKVDANDLFERAANALKLVGDQYLARVYRLLSGRLHLEEWELGIRRKLEVVEGVYRVVSDQADTYRTEVLEIIVIVLILIELVLAVYRH